MTPSLRATLKMAAATPPPNPATLSSLSIGEDRWQSAMPANQPARRGPEGGAAAWPRWRVLRACRKR